MLVHQGLAGHPANIEADIVTVRVKPFIDNSIYGLQPQLDKLYNIRVSQIIKLQGAY